jgi:EPS-associated MarR family transcriptional regulator
VPQRDEIELELLREIGKGRGASQRDLASRLGLSVGKLNYCLRATIEKGWVKAQNFRRSDSKLAYAYLLTPSGVSAKIRMAREFLIRKESEYEALLEEIERLRKEVNKEQGEA